MNARRPLRAGLWSLPLFYGVTIFVNVLSIILDGPKCKYFLRDFFFVFLIKNANYPLFIGSVEHG